MTEPVWVVEVLPDLNDVHTEIPARYSTHLRLNRDLDEFEAAAAEDDLPQFRLPDDPDVMDTLILDHTVEWIAEHNDVVRNLVDRIPVAGESRRQRLLEDTERLQALIREMVWR